MPTICRTSASARSRSRRRWVPSSPMQPEKDEVSSIPKLSAKRSQLRLLSHVSSASNDSWASGNRPYLSAQIAAWAASVAAPAKLRVEGMCRTTTVTFSLLTASTTAGATVRHTAQSYETNSTMTDEDSPIRLGASTNSVQCLETRRPSSHPRYVEVIHRPTTPDGFSRRTARVKIIAILTIRFQRSCLLWLLIPQAPGAPGYGSPATYY